MLNPRRPTASMCWAQTYVSGRTLASDPFRNSGTRYLGGAVRLVTCFGRHWGSTCGEWQSYIVVGRHVLLASGAMERPFPIAGWTLPGVMGAGAAQILLKGSGALPTGPVVLAGCGPLLYLLA